jgi:membrane-associated protease RseP (regulator of RpoE activity)
MKALTTSPREWRRVCKEAYKKYDGAWLILFPLGAVVPIECGLAHTLASTIILPLLMLPFGIVGGVLSVPFAMVSPDGWCDFPGKIGVGPVPEDPSRGQHCFGLEIEPRNGRESEPTPPDAGQEVRISRVVEGSPAARAGLEVEDRIVSIDGVGLESPGQLQLALGLLKPGDRVALRVLRNGALLDLEVQLEPEDWGRTEDCR